MIRITDRTSIHEHELSEHFIRASGPGGRLPGHPRLGFRHPFEGRLRRPPQDDGYGPDLDGDLRVAGMLAGKHPPES